jgi:transposase
VRWRERGDQPPSALALASPYEAEARCSTTRRTSGVGTTGQVTATGDPERPRLITQVETTPATTDAGQVVDTIQARLAAKPLLPGEHLLAAGSVDTAILLGSRAAHGVAVVGPVRTDHRWQAQAGQGFDAASFALDGEAPRVRCPRGRRARPGSRARTRGATPASGCSAPARCAPPAPAAATARGRRGQAGR